MPQWIWEQTNWPSFVWDSESLLRPLGIVREKFGALQGALALLGMNVELDTALSAMTADVVGSSEIEGIVLDMAQVRSSVAMRLGLETAGLPVPSHYIDGLVDVMMDACRDANAPMSHELLWAYHRNCFRRGGPKLGVIGMAMSRCV